MTTRTIPEYLEDERRNRADTELRTEEEAARIQPLRHGHHRTRKPELLAPVEAVARARKPAVAKRENLPPANLPLQLRKSHASPERRQRKPARWRDDPCMIFAVSGDPILCITGQIQAIRRVGEGSTDFDGHDLSVRILHTALPIRVEVQ